MIARDDLSNRLIHLTRDLDGTPAADRFLSILLEAKIHGSSRGIRGNYKCVCFSESPISKIAMLLAQPDLTSIRYRPFGVIVTKEWAFSKGARPAIYQSEDEFELLPELLRHRHVRYEPGKHDYTWEREWRIKSEGLILDPAQTTLVVPNRTWSENIQHNFVAGQQAKLRQLGSRMFGAFPHVDFPWSVIVLEDLGVDLAVD
jgi:hypothetical protein